MSSQEHFVPISMLSRRTVLQRIALGLTAAGLGQSLAAQDATEIHRHVDGERTLEGEYRVRYFNEHEFQSLERLSELIVPADEGGPSGRDGGAPEFIDLLTSENTELANIFSGGLLWLDSVMQHRYNKKFLGAAQSEQTGLLDALVAVEQSESEKEDTRFETSDFPRFAVYGTKTPSDLRRGVQFLDWVRKLVVGAYYTSPAGMKDLGFMGNSSHSEYEVPQEAIDYAWNRSPLSKG